MTHEPNGLQNRLSEIEERLNQIERHLVELGVDEPQAQPPRVEPEPVQVPMPAETLVPLDIPVGSDEQAVAISAAPHEEPRFASTLAETDPAPLLDKTQASVSDELDQSTIIQTLITVIKTNKNKDIPANRPKKKSTSVTPFELIVGGKWMAWIGAAAVVASVVFFLKLAYDQGWWDSVSPASRCLMAAAFGVAMIGGGEFCLRKISKAASVGLFGAGLSVLYLVAWAASARYQVVSMDVSFLLMAVVAVGGFVVTLRSKFMTIGVLSLVGGYAAPLLLSGLDGSDIVFLGYLTTLLAIALALAAAKPSEFRVLRFIALGMHSIPAFFWLASSGGTHWVVGIVFMTVWWSMVLGESLLAALRGRSAISNIVATLLSTAAYITAGAWLLNGFGPATGFDWLSIFTVAIAVVSGAVAVQFWSGLDVLRGRARTAIDMFSVALVAQAGVLLAVAIAFQFQDYGESLGWLALALGSIEIARRIPSRGIGKFGLAVGALAVVRVFSIDWLSGSALAGTTLAVGPVSFSAWSVLAMTAVFSVHLAARRLGIPDRSEKSVFRAWRVVPTVLAVASGVGWVVVSGLETSGDLLTIAWLVLVVVLFAAWRKGTHLSYFKIGLSGLVLVAGKWLFDAAAASSSSQSSADTAMPMLNSQMGLAVAVVASGAWAFLIIQKRTKIRLDSDEGEMARPIAGITAPAQIALIVGAIFFLIAVSFEIYRSVGVVAIPNSMASAGQQWQLLLTLLWTLGGVGIAAIAASTFFGGSRTANVEQRIHRPTYIIGFAWMVVAVCSIKWLVYDSLIFTINLTEALRGELHPLANLQMIVGIVIAGSLLALHAITRATMRFSRTTKGEVAVAASVVLLWALSFEVDRLVLQSSIESVYPGLLLRGLWLTLLWPVGGMVMFIIGKLRNLDALKYAGVLCMVIPALVWLSIETVAVRMQGSPFAVLPILNLQFLVGASLAIMLTIAVRLRGLSKTSELWQLSVCTIGMLGLWLGSIEIDRVFAGDATAMQTGLSVYWCIYAVGLILLGFTRRVPVARYVGIGLFGVTTVKVLIVDLSQADVVWRVVSFLVLGLLLIGTSIVYARFTPKILEDREMDSEQR